MTMRSFSDNLRYSTVGYLLRAISERHTWSQIVIHQGYLGRLPSWIVLPLLNGHAKGRFKRPPEMTIVLVHNYRTEPIMAKSLRYVGIRDFVVLRPRIRGPWRNSTKLVTLLEYLREPPCNTKYVFYCDSRDAIIRDDPAKAIACLEEAGCDLLMSATKFVDGYQWMPEVHTWADSKAQANGYSRLYMNAGVFVGRVDFAREVLEAGMRYVTDSDLTLKELRRRTRDRSLGERLTDFPCGVGCDQIILRYLHPQFYPRMKVDYAGRLALR